MPLASFVLLIYLWCLTLVESQAFFPAYFHTLESIKNMHGLVSTKKSKLPFGEQLVSLCINIEQPEYLHSTSCKEGFDFSCFGSGLLKILLHVQ
jgi:hypothetical protein